MTPDEYTEHLRKEASDAAQNTLNKLISDGRLSDDEAIESIVTFLDAILPLQELIPGPLGMILEAGDEYAIRKVVVALSLAVQNGQAKQERVQQRQARQERRERVRQEILNRMSVRENNDG